MSESAGLYLPMSQGPAKSKAGLSREIDVTAEHCFSFARRRWAIGAGKIIQSGLMIASGVFLLTQIRSTPNLAIQIAIVGGLIAIGGAAIAVRSLRDFFGGVSISPAGVNVRFAIERYSLPWDQVEKWQVNELAADVAEMPAISFWTKRDVVRKTVPGCHLTVEDYRHVRQVLAAMAPEREER